MNETEWTQWEAGEVGTAPPALGVFTNAPSTEDELIDAQKHCGRLEHELAMLKAGLGVGLRWSTTPPLMSGVYLNAHESELSNPLLWDVVAVNADGWQYPILAPKGPYWAGPITVEGP